MASRPWRRFMARIDPPKRVNARIAATTTRQALRTGFALKFSRDNRPAFKFFLAMLNSLIYYFYDRFTRIINDSKLLSRDPDFRPGYAT
jgi:hypothetical protein